MRTVWRRIARNAVARTCGAPMAAPDSRSSGRGRCITVVETWARWYVTCDGLCHVPQPTLHSRWLMRHGRRCLVLKTDIARIEPQTNAGTSHVHYCARTKNRL